MREGNDGSLSDAFRASESYSTFVRAGVSHGINTGIKREYPRTETQITLQLRKETIRPCKQISRKVAVMLGGEGGGEQRCCADVRKPD